MPKHKTNPRRIQATAQDVQKAKEMATKNACRYATALVFTALRNSEGYGKKRLTRVFNEANYIADRIAKGHLKVEDLIADLEKKTGVVIK